MGDEKRLEILEEAEDIVMEIYRGDCPRYRPLTPCEKCNTLMRILKHIGDEKEVIFDSRAA